MPPAGPGVWGGPTPAQTNTWGQQPWPGAAQTNNWGQQAWPEAGQTNTWGQQPWPGAAQVPPQMQQEETPTSRLPVPYQAQQSLQAMPPGPAAGGNAQLPAIQSMADLVAALPEDAGATYVPPMYTKPRPVIPRYRVASGLLSVLIVTLFLCGGVGYYVKASGKLTTLGQFYGLVSPPNAHPAQPTPLSVPKTTQVTGPAYGIINSATTSSRLNAQNVPVGQDIIFKPGQTIYLFYSVQRPGTVLIKWYTNGFLYLSNGPQFITTATTVTTSQEYAQPAEGMVDLYWNDQLAIRLYFVVM